MVPAGDPVISTSQRVLGVESCKACSLWLPAYVNANLAARDRRPESLRWPIEAAVIGSCTARFTTGRVWLAAAPGIAQALIFRIRIAVAGIPIAIISVFTRVVVIELTEPGWISNESRISFQVWITPLGGSFAHGTKRDIGFETGLGLFRGCCWRPRFLRFIVRGGPG
jgi:hypothetical protein